MEELEHRAQAISWLGGELKREMATLTATPFPRIHTFLTENLLHAIEKQGGGMRQVLTGQQEEKKHHDQTPPAPNHAPSMGI